MNNVFYARLRALCLGALLFGGLPLRLTAQAGPPVLNGRIGPDGKVQPNDTLPGTQAKPGAPAYSPTMRKAAAQFELAAKRQQQNRLAEALAGYQEFIRQVKTGRLPTKALVPAYKNSYQIYRQRDDRKAMETTLKQIIALSPEAVAYAELASLEATDRRFTEATADAERALQLKPPPPIASNAHFVLGAAALDRHDYTRAEAECATAIHLSATNPGAHYYYALTLFQEQKYQIALAEAEKAKQLAPAMTPAGLLIAAVKRQLGDLSGAVAAYADILKVAPRDQVALYYRAVLLQKMGKVNEALVGYAQEVSVYPRDADGQLALGALYYEKRNYILAARHFAAAHDVIEKRDPHDNRALIGLAESETLIATSILSLQERATMSKQAEAHFKEAMARDPKNPRLPFQLAELYRRVARYEDASAIYRKRIAAAPDEKDGYFGLADAYIMQLRAADAIEVWKSYRKHKPDDPLSYQRVAGLLETQGRWKEAVEENTLLLALDPHEGSAHLALANDYEQLQQYDKAEPEYKTVLGYDPAAKDKTAAERPAAIGNRQSWRLAAWRGLAKIEEDRGHFDAAISYLDRVRVEEAAQAKKDEVQPKPQVYVDIARLYGREKKPELAIKALTALTEVAPDDPIGFAELGAQYDAQGNTEEAVFALRKASQRTKDPIDYILKAADIYRRHGDLDKTIAEYERAQPKFPHEPRLLSPLAQTLELRGKDEQALTVYAALLQANPGTHWVVDKQATILTRLKRYNEARALREQLIDHTPDDIQGYADLAYIYTVQGKPADYLAWLKARAEKNPGQATLLGALVNEFARQQKADAGWAYLRGMMSRHQNDVAILDAYAQTLEHNGRGSDAVDVRGRMAALTPKDLEVQTEYADSLSASGRTGEAAQVFQAQIARTDLSERVRMDLRRMWAERLEQQGKITDAIAQYQEIARVQPQNFEAVAALIRLLKSTGQPATLITTIANLLKQPNFPPAIRVQLLNALGQAYEQKNNRDSARLEYQQALQIAPRDQVAQEGLKRVGTN